MARLPVTAENISPLKATFKVVLNAENVGLTAEQFVWLCHDNPELRFELTARKEIIVMAPAYSKTGARNFNISGQLSLWTERDGTGIGFDSNAGFTLPNGAVRSPDASWIRLERWNALSEKEQNSFGPICPDFVIELRSESNTLRELQEKMSEYMENGAKLAQPLKVSGEFPMDTVQMIAVGEETGNLDEMLDKISDYYDRAVTYGVKRLTQLIEPLFLILMGLMVGFIMASVLFPIFDLATTLKH